MPSSLEIEVKLTGDAKALAKAWEGDPLQGDPASEEVTKSLENVYFDTHDLRLRQLGYAFRIRKDGARLVQTLKSKDVGGKGIARRREWSSVVTSLEPDIKKIGDESVRKEIGELARGDLRPVFTTVVQRRQRLVKRADEAGQISVIEVAFDQGEILAGGQKEPIGEIEFELQRGQPAAIHELMADVLATASLSIETRSKSARGYALSTGKPPAAQKAAAVTLSAQMTPLEAFVTIANSCMEHWLANEPAARDGSDPEGVHQMRVGLRRLRSALLAFHKVIPSKDRDWMMVEVKWLLQQTGPARDWDVFLAELLQPIVAVNTGDAKMAGLVEAGGVLRAKSYKNLRQTIGSARYTAFVSQLGAWLEPSATESELARKSPGTMEGFASRLLQRRHKKAMKNGRGFAELNAAARHELRITLKKLRYSVEFFQTLFGKKRVKRYLRVLKALQDELGHLNDVTVSQRLLRELLAQERDPEARNELTLAAGVVVGWYAQANASNEILLREMWKDFASLKPFWGKQPKKR